jgi:ribosomal protein L11 methyltransferase
MNYLKYTFQLEKSEISAEVLIAYLSEFKYESFVEGDTFVEAYVPENESINESNLSDLLNDLGMNKPYDKELINDENWNAQWESDYPVVSIDDLLIVRAPFHQNLSRKYKYDIQIQPKMSFGTGHHETTYLMLQNLLKADVKEKDVLDMGSGTGVLGIAAYKLGARSVKAVDIEDWAYENTLENIGLNSAQIDVNKGDVKAIKGLSFDLILANINKNVLLSDMKVYAGTLRSGGNLHLSGFFGTDVDDLRKKAEEFGLRLVSVSEKSNWAAMHLKKPN